MGSGIAERLPRLWYRRRLAPVLWPLLPLSWAFAALSGVRRAAYRLGLTHPERLPVPVIVVGNLIAGGAGKTPLTLWLTEQLAAHGWRPGIVSRGYGAESRQPRLVDPAASAAEFGDEPLLLARRSAVPVAVCRDRAAAGRELLARHPECDVLVADDGLQHYRLARDVEIAVFDGRGVGNARLLPAGPLREPLSRLRGVDALVQNGGEALPALPASLPRYAMRLAGETFVSLAGDRRCLAADLAGRPLHAFAGIGDPARFFAHLSGLGLEFAAHAFPDHHRFVADDFAPARGGIALLTEKDAVKCAGLIEGEAWVLPVRAELASGLIERILEKIDGRKAA